MTRPWAINPGVTDDETRHAQGLLHDAGVMAGPCGAAALAAVAAAATIPELAALVHPRAELVLISTEMRT